MKYLAKVFEKLYGGRKFGPADTATVKYQGSMENSKETQDCHIHADFRFYEDDTKFSSKSEYRADRVESKRKKEFVDGILLKNLETSAKFPFVDMRFWDVTSQCSVAQRRQCVEDISVTVKGSALRLSPQYNTAQRDCTCGEYGTYVEEETIGRDGTSLLPKRPTSKNAVYYIGAFKSEGHEGNLTSRWRSWTGANFALWRCPQELELKRVSFYRHLSPSSDDIVFVLLIECSEGLSNKEAAMHFMERLRDRRCGGHGIFMSPENDEDGIRCKVGKAIAHILHSEDLEFCVSCTENESTESYFKRLWDNILKTIINLTANLVLWSHEVISDVRNFRFGKALLEFILGLLFLCILLCLIVAWATHSEDKFYDVLSRKNQTCQTNTEVFASVESVKTVCEDICHSVDEDREKSREDTQFTQEITESSDNSEVTESVTRESIRSEEDMRVKEDNNYPENELLHRVVRGEECVPNSERKRPVYDFRLIRPIPPTVKVYSLHKPQEIPGEVMDTLLCLKKNCNHDHSKIRLIGPKVIVYSSTKHTRSKGRRELQRQALDYNVPWMSDEISPTVGEQLFSEELELAEETSNVSTQTEKEPPTRLVIRTEAYMCGENNRPEGSCISGGSMTGTLVVSNDNYETRIIRESWSHSKSNESLSRHSLSRASCSNIRESISNSRPEMINLEEEFRAMSLDLGSPRAHSTINDEDIPEHSSESQETPPRSGDVSLRNAAAASSINSSMLQTERERSLSSVQAALGNTTSSASASTKNSQTHEKDSGIRDRGTPLLTLSRNIPYMGSEMVNKAR